MTNVTRIYLAWELRQVGQSVEYIAERVSRDRSTSYRWLAGIKGLIRPNQQAKKGRRVLSLRRAYRNCCGQKIVYLLKQEGIKLSLSSVYRTSEHAAPGRIRPHPIQG